MQFFEFSSKLLGCPLIWSFRSGWTSVPGRPSRGRSHQAGREDCQQLEAGRRHCQGSRKHRQVGNWLHLLFFNLNSVADDKNVLFLAYETTLQEGLHFEKRAFHTTFATVSLSSSLSTLFCQKLWFLKAKSKCLWNCDSRHNFWNHSLSSERKIMFWKSKFCHKFAIFHFWFVTIGQVSKEYWFMKSRFLLKLRFEKDTLQKLKCNRILILGIIFFFT